jgi:hypothetical protein
MSSGAAFTFRTSETGPTDGHTVNIGGGVVDEIDGGYSHSDNGPATASDNTVGITDGTVGLVSGGNSYSDSGSATATNNTVNISGGSIDWGFFGGYSFSSSGSASATNNIVNINSGLIDWNVSGGDSFSDSGADATATRNIVDISGGLIGYNVSGGDSYSDSGSASATNNIVDISGGSVDYDVSGGYSSSDSGSASATNNTVNINGGSIGWNVYGGYADSDGAGYSGDATGNTVNISGGAITGNVVGGYSLVDMGVETGSATGNTVTLSGNPTLGGHLYGGFVGGYDLTNPAAGMDAFSGNTLNVKNPVSGGIAVGGDLKNFEHMTFYLPTTFKANDIMLNVGGEADIAGSTVNVGIDGASSLLQAGDTVVLIKAGTLTGAPVKNTVEGQNMIQVMQGVTLIYDFDLQIDPANNRLLATLAGSDSGNGGDSGSGGDSGNGGNGPTLNPRTKALAETYLSGVALLNGGADVADQGLLLAISAARVASGLQGFGTISGGHLRYNTGSHIDVEGTHLIAGLAAANRLGNGNATVGAFFEHGEGDYNTHNSFATAARVKGSGDTEYSGIGVLNG